MRVDAEEEVSPDVCLVKGGVNLTKHKVSQGIGNSGGNIDVYKVAVAAVELKISQYFVRNGEFWVPFDIMPEIQEQQ